MNLNEVKKHVYLQIAIYIGIGICLILSLFAILITPAKAATQLITQDITDSVTTYNGVCSGGFKQYCVYHTYSTNASTFTIPNSELMGANNILSFAFNSNYGFYVNSPTTVTIEFTNNINNNSNYSCSIETTNGYTGTCNAIRTANNKMNLNFTSLGVNGNYQFFISNNGGINSSDYFGIKKIVVYQTVGSDNSDIINNANQNTTDIITNANSNTEDIINAINNGMTDMCTNIFNYASYYGSYNGATVQDISPNTIKIYSNSVWGWLQYKLPIEQGQTYYLKGRAVSSGVIYGDTPYLQVCGDTDCSNLIYSYENNGSFSTTFTATQDVYFRLFATKGTTPSTSTYYEVMISKEDKPFCAFGSTVSKIDEQTKAIEELNRIMSDIGFKTDDTNAYLKDDSNPTVDSEGIEDTLEMVQTNNPLSYLLTLPTNLLSAIINGLSSNTCQDFEIGKFGHVGRHDLGTYTFKFPCINVEQKIGSNLYNTIDIFVSVGILVLTIVKLYNTISNYLTLGAEDEVKAHSHFLTPMDFLGNILGGNIGGIGNSLSSMSGGL